MGLRLRAWTKQPGESVQADGFFLQKSFDQAIQIMARITQLPPHLLVTMFEQASDFRVNFGSGRLTVIGLLRQLIT